MILKKLGLEDFFSAISSWRIWYALGLQDIVIRYRGSVIGPFWITISTAITVYSMGFLYGTLFGVTRTAYLPYFAAGIITWSFTSMVLGESTRILLDSKIYMENIQLPATIYIFRLLFRNVIILFHNIPVYISVALIYGINLNLNIFWLIPGLLVLFLNGVFFATLVAFVSARFPDVASIVNNILQVLFFITPIMWIPESLPPKFQLLVIANPLYYLIDLVRDPLLGNCYQMKTLIGASVVTFVGLILFTLTLRTYGKRVIFWI